MSLALLQQIFNLCIVPLLGILTTFLVQFIKNKTNSVIEISDNSTRNKYISLLSDTITQCVIATNQTYVESLKKQGKFDKEAQEEAFKQTYNAVIATLTDEAVTYLKEVYGDLDSYIKTKIESEVNIEKN